MLTAPLAAEPLTPDYHEAFWVTLGGIAAVVGVVQVLATAIALRTYGVAIFRFSNPPYFSQVSVLGVLGLTSYYAQGFILYKCLRSLLNSLENLVSLSALRLVRRRPVIVVRG